MLSSEQDESSPPPQNGACPDHPGSCTLVAHNLVEDNNDPNVSGGHILHLIGAGILIAGGRNDTIVHNTVRRQGSWGILITPFPWLGRATTPGARCQGGLAVGGLCYFDTFGNIVAGNVLSANGAFTNPTTGNLADASHGRIFGTLGAEVFCASFYLGRCNGTVAPTLPTLVALDAALHATQRTPVPASMPARYPQQTTVTAPTHPIQPSLPNPCTRVPTNPWCPSH
jgi:hypothetical protein